MQRIIYADLLEALEMADHVLQPTRPSPSCSTQPDATPHTHTYSGKAQSWVWRWTVGSTQIWYPVSASFVQRERDALKASTISGSDSIGLITDKNGLLVASQGGKPVLPKARFTKIKTYEEWYAATDNL